jgi:hypothetical protein
MGNWVIQRLVKCFRSFFSSIWSISTKLVVYSKLKTSHSSWFHIHSLQNTIGKYILVLIRDIPLFVRYLTADWILDLDWFEHCCFSPWREITAIKHLLIILSQDSIFVLKNIINYWWTHCSFVKFYCSV